MGVSRGGHAQRAWQIGTNHLPLENVRSLQSPQCAVVFAHLWNMLPPPRAFLKTGRSTHQTAGQTETGFSTQLGRAFALGNQTGSRRHLSLWHFFFFLNCNLNWHHLILTLQYGLCRLNIMFFFPCTSSQETDGFIPTWKLVGMETIQKMIRELEAFWNWAQHALSHYCFNETCLTRGLLTACFLVLILSH